MQWYYITRCIKYDNVAYSKLGITSNPRSRHKQYKTLVPNIKFACVFGIECDKKDMLRFETHILHYYKKQNLRLKLSETIKVNNNEVKNVINYVYAQAKKKYTVTKLLTHEEAMQIEKGNNVDALEKFKKSIEGKSIIRRELARLNVIIIKKKTRTGKLSDKHINNTQLQDGKLPDSKQRNEQNDNTQSQDGNEQNDNTQLQARVFPYDLRGYQIEFYEKMQRTLATSDNVTMSVMCRCGKTVLFMKYIWDNSQSLQVIIYVTKRLILISEMAARFKNVFGDIPMYEISSSNSKYNTCISNINFKQRCILLVCSDSFGKLNTTVNEENSRLPSNVLFIFDEAHELACTIDDKNPMKTLPLIWQPGMKKIFATATPVYGISFKNNRRRKNKTRSIAYMNRVDLYGSNTIKFANISEALEQKFIVPMKIVIGDRRINYESNNVTTVSSSKYNIIHTRINAAFSIIEDIHNSDEFKYKPNKLLAYCNTTESIELVKRYIEMHHRGYKIFVLHSKMKNQDKIRNDFANCKEPCIMINCRMLVAGINIPDLDSIILVEPRYAKEDIIQIMFRARSYCPEIPNKISYLIIPVDNLQNGFNTLEIVIKELYIMQDPTVVKLIENARNRKRSNSNVEEKTLINTDLVCLSLDIKAKVLDIISDSAVDTLEKAILFLLSDNLDRTYIQIWNEIKTMINCDAVSCKKSCDILCKQEKILKIKTSDDIYKYCLYSKPRTKLTVHQFELELAKRNIRDYADYMEHFNLEFTNDFPIDIELTYTTFSWDDYRKKHAVVNSYYETGELFISAINALLANDEIKHKVKAANGSKNKLRILHSYDRKIPYDEAYKKIYNINDLFNYNGLIGSVFKSSVSELE